MATILPTDTVLGTGIRRITWSALDGGDDGAWVNVADAEEITVTVEVETGGSLTTYAFQGTNSPAGANPRTLEDTDGTALTALGVYRVKEKPGSIRPLVTTGVDVTTRVLAKSRGGGG